MSSSAPATSRLATHRALELAVDEDLVAILVWIVDHGKVAHDRNPTSRWLPSQNGLLAE